MIKKSTTNKFKTKVALISKAIEQETEEILRDAEVAAKMSLPFNVSGKSLVKIESKLMNEGIGAKFDTKMPRFASKEDEPETVEIEQEQIDTICECITNAVVEELEDVLKDAEEIIDEEIKAEESLDEKDKVKLENTVKSLLETDLNKKGIYVKFARNFGVQKTSTAKMNLKAKIKKALAKKKL